MFVGPDNGLLIPAVERLGGTEFAIELTQQHYWRPNPTSTFHVPDIFGPVAARVANGLLVQQLGRPIADLEWLALPDPHGLQGEVIHVDTYGNLITNLPAPDLPLQFRVRVAGRLVPSGTHYQVVKPGDLVALAGSAGLLEVSARDASAAELTGAARGTVVKVEPN